MIRRKTSLGISLLLIGLILLSVPFIDGWKQNKKVRALGQALELIQEQDEPFESTDNIGMNVEKQGHTTLSDEQLRNVIELEIPSIKLKEKVLDETNEENLSIALTQLKQGQVAGKGNFAIAGHRGYLKKHFFRKLPAVEQGDQIILHASQKKYIYKVRELQVIKPTEVEIVNDHQGKEEITLITCTIGGRKRIAVTGELAYIVEMESTTSSEQW